MSDDDLVKRHQADYKAAIRAWGWRLRRMDIKQEKFAKIVGCYPCDISNYLSFKVTPSLDRYHLIEDKLASLEKRYRYAQQKQEQGEQGGETGGESVSESGDERGENA